jgi:hypothetical protein
MRRLWIVALLVLAGCSSGDPAPERVSRPALTGAQAHAAAPGTAGALTQIPDGEAAQRRLGYVAVEALGQAELPFSARDVTRRVLGAGAAALPETGVTSAVQVGDDATALRGDALGSVDGVPSGDDGVVVGAGAQDLADPSPETSAITPAAQSAVQSCLGDTLAQTILGPGTMGDDAALGVGLAESQDTPAGLQLRLCGAPKFLRHIHAMQKRLEARFGDAEAVIEEREIGEREIVAGVVAAGDLPPRQLLRLLAGGRELRSLAWR